MSQVRTFNPERGLKARISLPGGKTLAAAVADAEAEIEAHRPDVIRDVDQRIAELERIAGVSGGPAVDEAERIYGEASAIVDSAGLFDLEDVGQAAYSLCELVDRLGHARVWDGPAVQVHVGSIRLLRGLPADAARERAQLLAGLNAVTAKYAVEAAG